MSDRISTAGLVDLAAVGKAIWWMVLLRGIFAIVFGVLAIAFPDPALVALALLFAVYSLLDGVTMIVQAIQLRSGSSRWGWVLTQGILSVIAGVLAAIFPVIAGVFGALILIYLIAFWSVFTGIAGFRVAQTMTAGGGKTWTYVTAVLSVLFGIALAVLAALNPGTTVSALIIAIGVYAVVTGVLLVVVAIASRVSAKRMLAT